MKTTFLLLTFFLCSVMNSFSQQRYLDEVFSNVQITSNVMYGQNISISTNPPMDTVSLVMDVYEPAGDTLSKRPLIIYLHAGDFLPIIWSTEPVGDMHDSTAVEMCKHFARRGYVAVSMDYRIGWVPSAIGAQGQDIRTGTLLQAVYRALQDAKTCVRYFKMNAATQGNTFKIDTGKIVIGGQGSAGYVATSYATLNEPSELTLLKFLSASTNATYGFVAGKPYVNQDTLGDFDGIGGIPEINISNWPGYSSKVEMVFNMEGALGDSTWMQGGELPMVSFHDVNNPLTPYTNGPVIVPATGDFVVYVTGNHDMIRIANQLGNNAVFDVGFNDPYTLRANQINDGWEGLFPIEQINPQIVIPGDPLNGQTGPWEWWDSTDLQAMAPLVGQTPLQATIAYLNGFLTNPDMSKEKALRYIDTVQGYLNPRIVQALQLPGFVGINEVNLFKDEMNLFPNPAQKVAHLKLGDPSSHLLSIKIYDLQGREVFSKENLMQHEIEIPCDQLGKGLFAVHVMTEKGIATGKLVIE